MAAGGIYYPKILFVQVQYPRRSVHGARGEDVISNCRKVFDGFLLSHIVETIDGMSIVYKAEDVKLDELTLKHKIAGSGNRAGMTF